MDLSRFTGPVAATGGLMVVAGLGDAVCSLFGSGIPIFGAITHQSPAMAWGFRGALVGVGLIVMLVGGTIRR